MKLSSESGGDPPKTVHFFVTTLAPPERIVIADDDAPDAGAPPDDPQLLAGRRDRRRGRRRARSCPARARAAGGRGRPRREHAGNRRRARRRGDPRLPAPRQGLFHTAEVDADLRRRAERLGAPILLKGDPGGTLDALDELLNGTPDHLDPRVALVVAALERNASDGVVIVDEELRLQFYDTGAADLLGDPVPLDLLQRVLRDAAETRDAAVRKIDGRCDVRAVPLLEGGAVVGIAAYLTAPER